MWFWSEPNLSFEWDFRGWRRLSDGKSGGLLSAKQRSRRSYPLGASLSLLIGGGFSVRTRCPCSSYCNSMLRYLASTPIRNLLCFASDFQTPPNLFGESRVGREQPPATPSRRKLDFGFAAPVFDRFLCWRRIEARKPYGSRLSVRQPGLARRPTGQGRTRGDFGGARYATGKGAGAWGCGLNSAGPFGRLEDRASGKCLLPSTSGPVRSTSEEREWLGEQGTPANA